MDEHNGIWVNDTLLIVDVLAEFIQNWLEDNISEKLYESSMETAKKFSDVQKFENDTVELFSKYINKRLQNFEEQLEKIQLN
jgi:hypothetical protein